MTTLTNQARSSSEADVLAITTIRTLCMDAVQAANSGHPGRPWRWRRSPTRCGSGSCGSTRSDPIWPNRDRFVLSAGHASTLLYALLHLAGVNAVNPAVRDAGRACGPARRPQDASASSTRKCPGHPEYRWTSGVESTTGPLGTGAATSVGMAIAARWQAAYFNRPGFDAVRLRRLRPLRRRRPDGGRLRGGGVAGRPPAAGQPVLDLRQQPHHHRGQHRARLHRGRGHALHRLRLERHPRRRRQRPRDARARLRHLPAEHAPAHARSSSTATSATAPQKQGTPRRTASRSARTRSAPPSASTAGPRTRSSSSRTRCTATSQPGSASADAPPATRGWRCSSATAPSTRDCADQLYRMQHRQLPEGWDADLPDVPPRRQGHGHPRHLGQGAQRGREARPVAARRVRGPRAVHQDAPRV